MIDFLIDKTIDLLSEPSPPPPGGFIDSLPEAFGALDENNEVFVIGYKGEWFHQIRPSLKTRLHNRLVSLHNRRWLGETDDPS